MAIIIFRHRQMLTKSDDYEYRGIILRHRRSESKEVCRSRRCYTFSIDASSQWNNNRVFSYMPHSSCTYKGKNHYDEGNESPILSQWIILLFQVDKSYPSTVPMYALSSIAVRIRFEPRSDVLMITSKRLHRPTINISPHQKYYCTALPAEDACIRLRC